MKLLGIFLLISATCLRPALGQPTETIVAASDPASAAAACALPWLFFDLGEGTLLDTDHDSYDKITYMPGALAYLQDLRAKGYHVGLLVNVPSNWGKTQSEKMIATRSFIAASWVDTIPMNWKLFDLGITFPESDADRKPAPKLFELATNLAHRAGCDAVYQGSLPDEIVAARNAGMIGIVVGKKTYDGAFYYPETRLRERDFSLVSP